MDDTLLKELQKMGMVKGSDESLRYTRLPFGLPPLDRLTGGGIPRKRITMLVGPTNTGKSFLASQCAAAVQKAGGLVLWLDLELSWDPDWMTACGVDVENIFVAQPTAGEDVFDLVLKSLQTEVDLVVLDSVASIVPTALQDNNFSYNPVAWQARFINQALPRVLPHLKNGAALLLINQFRSGLGPVSFDNIPGGIAQSYFAHFILEVRRGAWIKNKDDAREGFEMEIRCRKTKVGGEPFSKCQVPFRFRGGFDLLELYMREFIAKGVVEKSGAWFAVKGIDKKIMGMNGLRKFFEENDELFRSFSGRINLDDEGEGSYTTGAEDSELLG